MRYAGFIALAYTLGCLWYVDEWPEYMYVPIGCSVVICLVCSLEILRCAYR